MVGFAKQLSATSRALGTAPYLKAAADLALFRASPTASMLKGSGHYSGAHRGLGGRGEYSAPVINGSEKIVAGGKFVPPRFRASLHDEGGMVVSHQEFVQNIYGNPVGSSFESLTFAVNPGLPSVFAWLSQLAGCFEKYEMKQCVFHVESVLDEGVFQSDTGQVGELHMYSHTRPDAIEFQNSSEFAQNGGSSTRVTNGLMEGVECDPSQLLGLPNAGFNYLRSGPVKLPTYGVAAGSTSVDEFDQAKLQLAVTGTPDTLDGQVIGRLYVSYTVEFAKPRIYSMLSRSQLNDSWVSYSTGRQVVQNGYLPTFGETLNPLSCNNMGISLTPTDSNTSDGSKLLITFPDWVQGLVTVECHCDIDVAGEPGTVSEISNANPQWIIGIVYTGECKGASMFPIQNSDSELSGIQGTGGGDTANQQGATGSNGGANPGVVCIFKRMFRVSQSINVTNTIELEASTAADPVATGGPATLGAMRTYINIRVDNDFGAVGSQNIDRVASITIES